MYLVNDAFIEAERDVCLKRYGHALKERAKTDTLIPLPVVLIVAGKKTEGNDEQERKTLIRTLLT